MKYLLLSMNWLAVSCLLLFLFPTQICAQYFPTPPKEVSGGVKPPTSALLWLEGQQPNLTARDFILLERCQAALYANVLDGPWNPLQGICPSPYMYLGIWNWDAAFHAMAVARWDGTLARDQIKIFLDRQTQEGAFIDAVYQDGNEVNTIGKPPVMPWVCMIVHRRSPDLEFLRSAYRSFSAYEQHWSNNRGGRADGLFHYGGSEPYFEAGWDNSVRWDPRREDCGDWWPIDLNCYMVMLYRSMADMALALGENNDVGIWKKREQDLIAKINKLLWDDTRQVYLDRNRKTREFSTVLSPASFMPLYVGIASKSKAFSMSVLAGDTSKFFPGFPTVAYDHPEFRSDAYWRGPAWLNVSYMALKGLQRYGYQTIADAGRQTILTWCDQNSDTLWEYYDSKTGKGLGTKQYGWTAAWLIEFILNWEDKTDP